MDRIEVVRQEVDAHRLAIRKLEAELLGGCNTCDYLGHGHMCAQHNSVVPPDWLSRGCENYLDNIPF